VLDLILTGRPVGAKEALQFGRANRVVETGMARAAAESLAGEPARFPQRWLMSVRRSAREQFVLSWEDALKNEFNEGPKTI